jgi:hypothetical protein
MAPRIFSNNVAAQWSYGVNTSYQAQKFQPENPSHAKRGDLNDMRVIEKADVAKLEPLLCSIKAAVVLLGRSERFVIDALSRGLIKGVKSDRRTMIVVESLRDYVASLEPARGTPNPPRRRVRYEIVRSRRTAP